ncbi:sugar ABC transporter substrate-binding protein [Sorangium cellulosum]|uniref:ABC transporter substrate-binding protein n=1 Tax=Sorangium cellulosum TaxID=56 RepID=A0A150QL99_SORCE|nr:sugar ABC transporter substrate-binding protein [Sorangium cellulosum]KYF68476.1 ABC transporter substrate-binding protein [Sorangium cellulosum]
MKTNAISGRLGAWALSALVLTSCSQKQEGAGDKGSAAGDKGAAAGDKASKPAEIKIALLLPESKTARYESKDRPFFEAKIKALCPECQILASNANQDASQQQAQAEAALTNGARVLVLDAVDSASASVIATKAKAQKVPVIAYDRLVPGTDAIDFYVSFDNESVGRLQGESLLTALGNKPTARVVMINGAPTDNNGMLFKKGAHSALDGKAQIVKEYDTPDWSPDKAQDQMTQALTALNNQVDGVYAANDGTAGGAIAAMKAAGIKPLPPVTGQDAELAAVQRILLGEQYMTVYKAIKPQAEAAAVIAVHLATGKPVPTDITGGKTVNNGKKDVPSVLLVPLAVTRENLKDTVIADAFWTTEQICTNQYVEACKAAGIL